METIAPEADESDGLRPVTSITGGLPDNHVPVRVGARQAGFRRRVASLLSQMQGPEYAASQLRADRVVRGRLIDDEAEEDVVRVRVGGVPGDAGREQRLV